MIIADLKDLELELWLRKRETGLIGWETKDGTRVPLKEMSDSHLVNTINMLKRNQHNLSDEYPWSEIGPGDGDNMY